MDNKTLSLLTQVKAAIAMFGYGSSQHVKAQQMCEKMKALKAMYNPTIDKNKAHEIIYMALAKAYNAGETPGVYLITKHVNDILSQLYPRDINPDYTPPDFAGLASECKEPEFGKKEGWTTIPKEQEAPITFTPEQEEALRQAATKVIAQTVEAWNKGRPIHEQLEMCTEPTTKYYKASEESIDVIMDPRRWTQEMNDAWCRNIPDLNAAFAALREIYNKAGN